MKRFALKLPARSPKNIAYLTIILGVVVYLIGLKWPLLIIVAVSLVRFMPMPKVFDSWLSRLLMAVFFIYALLQIAAVAQVYLMPTGKFGVMAAMLAALTAVLIALFGSEKPQKSHVFTFKDLVVVISFLLFIVPFVPILKGDDASLHKITGIGGGQVVDSIAHKNSIVKYTKSESMAADYKNGQFYPLGFHISTAFMEHSVLGNTNKHAWSTNAKLYFAEYAVLALFLAAALIYFGFGLAGAFGIGSREKVLLLAVGAAIGVGTTILHLWPFLQTGFLNYYYITATVLLAAAYLLDRRPVYNPNAKFGTNKLQFTWPVFAFLLLGFGASCSWPLLVPVILLSALLALLPLHVMRHIQRNWRTYALLWLPIIIAGVLNLLMAYLQSAYRQGNDDLVLMGGAIQSYNALILLIGLTLTGLVIYKTKDDLSSKWLAIVMPFMLLVAGLMALHFFMLGEPRYYLIKCAMLLEMFFLALFAVCAAVVVRKASLSGIVKVFWVVLAVVFVVLGTIATAPQPLSHIRALFRDQSNTTPLFFENDTRQIAKLGAEGKLKDFNMTILHYDAAGDRFHANIQPASWALLFTRTDSYIRDAAEHCFDTQFGLLSQDTRNQNLLRQTVKECAAMHAQHGGKYYIVTDKASVDKVHETFGDTVEIVY